MSGLTLSELREALATQIRDNLERETTVKPYPDGKPTPPPSIVVHADPAYMDPWKTYGPGGEGLVRFVVELDPEGKDVESAHRRRDDYLSVGTGNNSSILDALMLDSTCGIDGCVYHVTGITATEDDTGIGAAIAIECHIRKTGAEV
jgi:hypothetical protein